MTAANPDVATLLAQVVQLLASNPPTTVPEPRAEMPQDRVLLSVEEAANRLGIGRTFAWRLVRTGDLKSVQIGRLRRIHVDAIREYTAGLTSKGMV
jgi:excisionase family DNA binding protein